MDNSRRSLLKWLGVSPVAAAMPANEIFAAPVRKAELSQRAMPVEVDDCCGSMFFTATGTLMTCDVWGADD